MYSREGKLIADEDQRSNSTSDYVYLNGSLVAIRSATIGTSTYATSYQHTDSLGSPVAVSDNTKTVTRIERYTPYGEPSIGAYQQGPGFTGHVTDALTGLTYAQQRYYDPILGRFLSPDPVQTDTNTGMSFNRFNYANNNPYKFTDPDGRDTKVIINANTSWDPETWWGTHAGLYLDSSFEKGSALLYDPNGHYNPGMMADPPRGDTRSSGGFFEGADASLAAYIKYQKTDGPKVLLYVFKTTPEQEKEITENIIELGDSRGLTCATDVSTVLDGIGPFKGLGIQDTPAGLQAKLNELKRKQDKEEEAKKGKKSKGAKDTKKDVKETKNEKK
ncbi:MAG: RHS repeat-associated core domain-containing protein [Arenimonas sp.]